MKRGRVFVQTEEMNARKCILQQTTNKARTHSVTNTTAQLFYRLCVFSEISGVRQAVRFWKLFMLH